MRHPTPTEFSLFYRDVLNVPDTEWLSKHLEECDNCKLEAELHKAIYNYHPINESYLKKLYKRIIFKWRWKRMWKEICKVDEELKGKNQVI